MKDYEDLWNVGLNVICVMTGPQAFGIREYNVMVCMRMPPKVQTFEYFVVTWWNCLGRIRSGLTGGYVSLGSGIAVSIGYFMPCQLWLFHCCVSSCKLPATAVALYHVCLLPHSHAHHWWAQTMTILTCETQINSFFYNCLGHGILSHQLINNQNRPFLIIWNSLYSAFLVCFYWK